MQKSFREFLGTPICDRLNKGLLGKVSDLIVNPVDGEVLAFFIRRDKKLLLPTVDVLKVASGVIWVDDPEALVVPDEIIRIADVLKLNTPVFSNKVFTVSRQYLGEVVDFRFETNGWILTKIDVAKKILGIATEKKLINATQIVRIKPNEITVRDAVVKIGSAKEKKNELTSSFAPAALSVDENFKN